MMPNRVSLYKSARKPPVYHSSDYRIISDRTLPPNSTTSATEIRGVRLRQGSKMAQDSQAENPSSLTLSSKVPCCLFRHQKRFGHLLPGSSAGGREPKAGSSGATAKGHFLALLSEQHLPSHPACSSPFPLTAPLLPCPNWHHQ